MRTAIRGLLVGGLVGICLACAAGPVGTTGGTGGGSTSLCTYDGLAYTTWKHNRSTFIFLNDTEVKTWWANMAGKPVVGTYIASGDTVTIDWGKPDNMNDYQYTVKKLDGCSMALIATIDKAGDPQTPEPKIWKRSLPSCGCG